MDAFCQIWSHICIITYVCDNDDSLDFEALVLLSLTCRENPIEYGLLRISTACSGPLFSLILYVDWLNFIVVPTYIY